MAKTRKMSPSMDAWRKHVAKVASAEGVKYGDAMRMANKGKYASEWKQIQASVSKGKKGGMASKLEPADYQKGGNVDEVLVEEKDMTMSGGEPAAYEGKFGSNAAPLKGGRRKSRKSRKTRKSRKGKRGGALLSVIA
jgi:hypothetical protein